MNEEHEAPSKELLVTLLLLGLLPGSANYLGVPIALVAKSGGLCLPCDRRRELHLFLGIRKTISIWDFGEEV